MHARLPMRERVAVFEMHIPNALGELADAIQRVAAAKCPVPGVEDQPDKLRIGQVQQALGLVGRLHPGAGVMMQNTAQAGLVAHAPRGVIRALGESAPAVSVQAHVRRDAPGVLAAQRMRVGVRTKHDFGVSAAGGRQQVGSADAGFGAFVMPRAVLKVDIDPRAKHLQIPPPQFVAQSRRVGRHETPVAKLRAGIAAGCDFVQHAGVVVALAFDIFDNAPRAGRVRNLEHGRLQHFRKLTSPRKHSRYAEFLPSPRPDGGTEGVAFPPTRRGDRGGLRGLALPQRSATIRRESTAQRRIRT